MTFRNRQSMADPTVPLLRLCLVLAGLAGALGAVFLAMSAHANASPLLRTAAQMLLFHAPLFLGLGLLAQARRVLLLPVTVALLSLGLCLFSGDLLLRAFVEQRLFSMAAPIGGALVIAAWLALAIGALRVRPK
ncbi:DUF423 domain-containing protein [Roseibium sediminicola]|uniref:DUF423 domain-containing protein n=1 Tax=Roseibium sediminicola TaxID=2933272 RepID=A0ABT0GRJ0_9HYPH|nr:DUF423 domain-containing protein [Roseibium sp. CAU 1639]MCK7612052.1 DUF423 domain-containing protein [Roseibium sp. CAU 1639]